MFPPLSRMCTAHILRRSSCSHLGRLRKRMHQIRPTPHFVLLFLIDHRVVLPALIHFYGMKIVKARDVTKRCHIRHILNYAIKASCTFRARAKKKEMAKTFPTKRSKAATAHHAIDILSRAEIKDRRAKWRKTAHSRTIRTADLFSAETVRFVPRRLRSIRFPRPGITGSQT